MTNAPSRTRRTASAALAVALIWSQLLQAAGAASTDLADTPMATAGRAKPNLIFVVDDSGSMDSEFLPVRGLSTNDGAGWWNTTDRRFVGRDANDNPDPRAAPVPGSGLPVIGPINFNKSGNSSTTSTWAALPVESAAWAVWPSPSPPTSTWSSVPPCISNASSASCRSEATVWLDMRNR